MSHSVICSVEECKISIQYVQDCSYTRGGFALVSIMDACHRAHFESITNKNESEQESLILIITN